MDYVGTILQILKAGLSIWQNKEATKYLGLVIEIEGRIANERKKPIYVQGMPKNGDYRNDLILDDCLRELATIGKGFAAASRNEIPKSVS